MTASLRVHRRDQVFIADQAAGLAADCLQMPHGQVHAVLCGGTEVVVGLRPYRGLGRGEHALKPQLVPTGLRTPGAPWVAPDLESRPKIMRCGSHISPQ